MDNLSLSANTGMAYKKRLMSSVQGYAKKRTALRWFPHNGNFWEETGYGNGVWKEFMQISPNPSTHTNITYCFLATDVEKISEQHLEDTENLTVHLLSLQEVKDLLQQGSIRQALMAAPLWKYMAERII